MRKAGFDVPDPYEAIDSSAQQSTASLLSDVDRRSGVVVVGDAREGVGEGEGSVSSGPSSLLGLLPSPDKNTGADAAQGPDDGLGKRYSVEEDDEDLFHRVVETMEPVVVETAGVEGAQGLEVMDCEDETLTSEWKGREGGGGEEERGLLMLCYIPFRL